MTDDAGALERTYQSGSDVVWHFWLGLPEEQAAGAHRAGLRAVANAVRAECGAEAAGLRAAVRRWHDARYTGSGASRTVRARTDAVETHTSAYLLAHALDVPQSEHAARVRALIADAERAAVICESVAEWAPDSQSEIERYVCTAAYADEAAQCVRAAIAAMKEGAGDGAADGR